MESLWDLSSWSPFLPLRPLVWLGNRDEMNFLIFFLKK